MSESAGPEEGGGGLPSDAVTRDGSPVAVYRRLPPADEAELIHADIPAGASVLELGCGTGRIAAPLAALGHPVTGVDDSPAMLAELSSAVEGHLGDARTVRLGRRFGVVLLASHLLNDDDADSFLATAAVHLEPGGVVVAQVYPPGMDWAASVGRSSTLGPVGITVTRATASGDRFDAEVRYAVDGQEWRQRFGGRMLDEATLRAMLAEGGFEFDRWLGRPGWFAAFGTDG